MTDNIQVSRFQPLQRVLTHDVFNDGFNGWMVIMPNFCNEGFEQSPSIVIKDQWPPCMLSTATFRYPGSHGSMSGQYSLKTSWKRILLFEWAPSFVNTNSPFFFSNSTP